MYKNLNDLKNNLHRYSGITTDSRKVKKNFIFVAVKGRTVDGHSFISEAVKNGASVIVSEKEVKENEATRIVKVKDSREASGKYSSEFYGNPSKKLKVIGITGTKGKTTTTHLIYHMLTSAGKKVGLVSSIMAKIGSSEIDTGFHVTSPDVVSLHKFLKKMVNTGCKYAVIEVSSHGIDQKRIAEVKFEVGVLTNIAPEHLDYHKTFAEYKKVKMSFIKSCRHQVIAPKETDLNILPGKFNNLNVEAALRAVEILGLDRKNALKSLDSFDLPEGRLEEIKNSEGFRIFVDFAHTPDSLEAALKYLRTQTSGKLVAVFGSAGERDKLKRPKMGRIAAKLADEVILTAEDPRSEKTEDIIAQIKSGIKSKNAKIYEEPDREKAIELAIKIAEKGSVVGIFGKGHEKSMNLDGIHEIPWSDRKIVRECIGK